MPDAKKPNTSPVRTGPLVLMIDDFSEHDRTRRIPIIACSGVDDPPRTQVAWADAVRAKPCVHWSSCCRRFRRS
jgi:hypothetical protein